MFVDTPLASIGQVFRKLCMLKPPYCQEPLLCHCSSRALTTPHSIYHISKLTSLIKVFLSILESSCHELRIAHGVTFMTFSPCGYEAFPMPGALIHTRITWTLWAMAPQSRVSLRGPPCADGVLGIPYGEVRNTCTSLTSTPQTTI